MISNGSEIEHSEISEQSTVNIMPILAVLPAGLSLYEDYKNGYYRQILIRGAKKKYYLSKIAATFISGGMALLSMLVTFYVEYRFVILIFPFSLYYFTECLDRIFGNNDFSPNYFLIPGFPERYLWEYIVLFGIIVAAILLAYFKGKKYGKDS